MANDFLLDSHSGKDEVSGQHLLLFRWGMASGGARHNGILFHAREYSGEAMLYSKDATLEGA